LPTKGALAQILIAVGVLFVVGIGVILGAIGTLAYLMAYENMVSCFSSPTNLCPNYHLILANDLKNVTIGALTIIIGIIMIILITLQASSEKERDIVSKVVAEATVS
jgi:hypothetical protein